MANGMQEYVGGCHCGAIGFSYCTALKVPDWSIRACQCGFCRAHGARTTSDPDGNVSFSVREPGMLSLYKFGQSVTDFLVCSRCGVYIGALIETSKGKYGIVNVNAFESVPADIQIAEPMYYGAESKQERIARREQRWSPAEIAR